MNIQIIGKDWENKSGFAEITLSPLSMPRSLDEFDINIIDLNTERLWRYKNQSYSTVDDINHLQSIFQMVKNSSKSKIIYVLPKNYTFLYHVHSHGYYKSVLLKDELDNIKKHILSQIVYPNIFGHSLMFENTRTEISGKTYEADFYFSGTSGCVTKSRASEKITTIILKDGIYATTLNITYSYTMLINFIDFLFKKKEITHEPDWFSAISFGDDSLQRDIISAKETEIENAKNAINMANEKLSQNNRYKSILYTNGNELVEVVFEMLEKLLDCDLSEFEDKKDEDFLIKTEQYTFIGEIKGVTSNVKNDHIGQIEHHYQRYMDELEEKGITESVHQILIINPFRNKQPETCEPIHEKQINLAKRNGCLIIETSTLLRIFEKYQAGAITSEQCIQVFCNRTGLLNMTDFIIESEGNLSDFLV